MKVTRHPDLSGLETLLRDYIDVGVDDQEIRQIALASLAERIRSLKLQIARAIVEAKACLLLDNLQGSSQALKAARGLKRQYQYFHVEWCLLAGESPPPSEGQDGSLLEGSEGLAYYAGMTSTGEATDHA